MYFLGDSLGTALALLLNLDREVLTTVWTSLSVSFGAILAAMVVAGVVFLLSAWLFLDIDAVYSRTLDTAAKLLLAGFALVGSVGLAVLNLVLRKKAPQKLLFTLVAMYALTSLVLTPIWIWTVTPGYSIWLNLPLRLLKMPIETTFYILILLPLLPLYDRLTRKAEGTAEA